MISNILQSRKFWLAVADAVFATATVVLGMIYAPEQLDIILKVLAIWQAVVVALIVGVTVEEVAKLRAGVHPLQTNRR